MRGGGGTKASTDGTHRGEGGVNLSQILKLKNDGKGNSGILTSQDLPMLSLSLFIEESLCCSQL